ncbi:hypothetical protein PSY76_23595, partial [Shigella flexneri]|nr:hypothetical protein [Shigella flexneri]
RSRSPSHFLLLLLRLASASHDGWQMQVEEVKEENGLLTYIGTRLDTEESDIGQQAIFFFYFFDLHLPAMTAGRC